MQGPQVVCSNSGGGGTTSAPEPSSLMLIGTGLLGLGLVRHAKQSCLMAGIGAPGAAMASRKAQRFDSPSDSELTRPSGDR
jgi:hypothetical protein